MSPTFEPVKWPGDAEAVVRFLTSNGWPFHGRTVLTPEEASAIAIDDGDTISFWVRRGGEPVGLIRVLDLSDLATGSPLFDIRLAETARGNGVGTAAVRWLTSHLFATYPELMRIEATTRHDNVAMQTVFHRCGYRLEGRLVEAWVNADGTRHDTLVYAILRREWREADIARLAVYGTLAPGRANHGQLSHLDGHWFAGSVRGRLHDAGWGAAMGFPGLVLEAEAADGDLHDIDVQIFESRQLGAEWARLDEFEGPGYRRVLVDVATSTGPVPAFIYVLADEGTPQP